MFGIHWKLVGVFHTSGRCVTYMGHEGPVKFQSHSEAIVWKIDLTSCLDNNSEAIVWNSEELGRTSTRRWVMTASQMSQGHIEEFFENFTWLIVQGILHWALVTTLWQPLVLNDFIKDIIVFLQMLFPIVLIDAKVANCEYKGKTSNRTFSINFLWCPYRNRRRQICKHLKQE